MQSLPHYFSMMTEGTWGQSVDQGDGPSVPPSFHSAARSNPAEQGDCPFCYVFGRN